MLAPQHAGDRSGAWASGVPLSSPLLQPALMTSAIEERVPMSPLAGRIGRRYLPASSSRPQPAAASPLLPSQQQAHLQQQHPAATEQMAQVAMPSQAQHLPQMYGQQLPQMHVQQLPQIQGQQLPQMHVQQLPQMQGQLLSAPLAHTPLYPETLSNVALGSPSLQTSEAVPALQASQSTVPRTMTSSQPP